MTRNNIHVVKLFPFLLHEWFRIPLSPCSGSRREILYRIFRRFMPCYRACVVLSYRVYPDRVIAGISYFFIARVPDFVIMCILFFTKYVPGLVIMRIPRHVVRRISERPEAVTGEPRGLLYCFSIMSRNALAAGERASKSFAIRTKSVFMSGLTGYL